MIINMNALPITARVVVIGGGIAGCSAAYHLAMLGVSDVLLLERSSLSSGTTWHSTGNMETYRHDALIFEMVQYAAELYPRLARETGNDIGWRNVGRVMYTDRAERWDVLRTLPELGRARGIEIALLTPDEVLRRLPIISTNELIGGVWVPSDARVNPTDAVMALASAARSRGVKIRSDVPVLGIVTRNGSVQGISTPTGTIECETVVVAAGLWSAEVLRSCGSSLPLYALEHQYLITKPLGIDRNLPLFISYDDQLYGREDVGGLMVGSLDDHAIPLSAAELPQNFSFALLSERWDQFEPYMAIAMRRFPLLQTAGIKMLLNGPESFTPDGQMLLGPFPGTTGVFVACGFNSNGMALAPAAGRFVAEWIVEGTPSADVAKLDVRRFSAVQSTEAYLRDRVTEMPGYHCRIHEPDADYSTARDVRRSPLHAQFVAAGARFGAVNGWERPLWVAQDATPGDWLAAVAVEEAAATDGVLIVDRSADVKVLLIGDAVDKRLAATAATGWPGNSLLQPLPGRHGEVEALVRLLPLAPKRTLLAAAPDQETRVLEWLRCNCLPDDIHVVDVTPAYAMLELHGPRRGELLKSLTANSVAETTQPQIAAIGAALVHVHEDSINDSTLIAIPSDGAAEVWRVLGKARGNAVLHLGGQFAQEAIRIHRGIPAFGREATPARLIQELVSIDVSAHPLDALARTVPKTHRARRLAAYMSPMPLLEFGTGETILGRGRTVGELTSRVRLPGWHATLALGLLDSDDWAGPELEVVAAGKRWPLMSRETPWNAVR